MRTTDIIHAICCDPAISDAARTDLVNGLATAEDLALLLNEYNWDDGFDIPTAIAFHPSADLAVAIKLYWLSDADHWHDTDEAPKERELPHQNFSRLISERILSGHYQVGTASYDPGFGPVDLYKLQKRNFPEVFYTAVVGKAPKP